MTERAEIAAAVAKALGLELIDKEPRAIVPIASNWIWSDGSDVFSDPWFRLALEWLTVTETYEMHIASIDKPHRLLNIYDQEILQMFCPAAEFPARAIHALEREER